MTSPVIKSEDKARKVAEKQRQMLAGSGAGSASTTSMVESECHAGFLSWFRVFRLASILSKMECL